MSADPARSKVRMPKLGLGPQIFVFLLILGLLGAMAIEPTRKLVDQRNRIDQASQELTRVNRSNQRLQARIDRLRDPDYVDQLARSQAGLVKPGEIAFVVMPPGRGASPARKAASHIPDKAPPPEPSFVQSVLAFVGI
jgi:cell division protein DivIC